MNEEPDNKSTNDSLAEEPVAVEPAGKPVKRRAALLILVAVVAMTVIAGTIIFLLRSTQSGKPVPAPRTVSFEEPSNQSPATSGEQRLTLTTEQMRSTNLKIETVGERPVVEAAGQLTTGTVQANSYKETPVVSLVGGIVKSVSGELGQNVRRGQRLAVVFSNELAEAQSRYLAAIAALDEHHRHHLRTIKLVDIGAASRQELETATSQYREAESNVANLKQKLMLLGMSTQSIESLNSTTQISSQVYVSSPSTGTITSRTVNSGEVIEANKELLRVTDLSNVWVVGQVYEKDLATIKVGSGANITSDAYPGRVFRGRVSYVDPKIDVATRTAQVRIELPNPGQIFKIGMYVNVALGALGVGEKTMPAVPKAAVQSIGTQQFVFIPTEKSSEFLMRAILIGMESNGFYPVEQGLQTGDRVVTDGSFLLRAEWMKQHPNQ